MKPWMTTVVVASLCIRTRIGAARAQEPVTGDTTAPADTMAAAVADTAESLADIEARLIGKLGAADSAAPTTAPARGGGAATLNPDISLIADFLVDLSPDEATLEDGDRFQVREVEIGVQGAVDPYFRYDAFLGFHGDGIEIEEAYATTLALPASLQARLGRFLLPFGKVNLTHRAELQMFDYPLVHRAFFGEEGFSSTGVWGSWIGGRSGSTRSSRSSAPREWRRTRTRKTRRPTPAPVQTRKRTGGKSLRGPRGPAVAGPPQELARPHPRFQPRARRLLGDRHRRGRRNAGADQRLRDRRHVAVEAASVREIPLGDLQAEAIWRAEAGPAETRFGAFAYAQWQLSRRWYVGARGDCAEPPEEDGTLSGGQLLVKWFPTEFSQLRLAYERQDPEEGAALDRLIFQTTFALGPHRPHAF